MATMSVGAASNLCLFSYASSTRDHCRRNYLPFHQVHHHHRNLCFHGNIPPKSPILRRARVRRAEEEDEGDVAEEEEGEGSVEILLEILQGFFRKVSRRAKKAARSVLPAMIPSKLVSFAVDGTVLFSLLSVTRALLQVASNLGAFVFVAILIVRTVNAIAFHFGIFGSPEDNMDDRYPPTSSTAI